VSILLSAKFNISSRVVVSCSPAEVSRHYRLTYKLYLSRFI